MSFIINIEPGTCSLTRDSSVGRAEDCSGILEFPVPNLPLVADFGTNLACKRLTRDRGKIQSNGQYGPTPWNFAKIFGRDVDKNIRHLRLNFL